MSRSSTVTVTVRPFTLSAFRWAMMVLPKALRRWREAMKLEGQRDIRLWCNTARETESERASFACRVRAAIVANPQCAPIWSPHYWPLGQQQKNGTSAALVKSRKPRSEQMWSASAGKRTSPILCDAIIGTARYRAISADRADADSAAVATAKLSANKVRLCPCQLSIVVGVQQDFPVVKLDTLLS